MLESGLSGSVRGALSNERPYRDPGSNPEELTLSIKGVLYPRIADIQAAVQLRRFVPRTDIRRRSK
jgi:hypothetical protein